MRLLALLLLVALVAAPARAQGPRTLDDLWTEACLWEVGSNAEKVPAARNALIARGDEALAFLVPEKLDTKDTLVTRALSVVVTGIRGSAAGRLRAALAHEKPNVRRNAADLLGQLGDAESAASIARLLDDADTRGGALTALGALKARESVPAIAAILGRRDGVKERERVLAATTLGGIGGAEARDALVRALSSEAQVRFAAQAALEKLGAEAVASLLPLPAGAADRRARLHAVAALGNIGEASAASALLPLLRDRDAMIRGFAAEAVGRLKRPEDAALLRELLGSESDPFVRGKLEEALRGR